MAQPPIPAPATHKRPEHRVALAAGPARVRVMFNGEVIADTAAAVTVRESNYQPVHYIPLPMCAPTCCGRATTPAIARSRAAPAIGRSSLGDKRAENAVWAYDEPYDEVAELKGKVAFYPSQVDSILID